MSKFSDFLKEEARGTANHIKRKQKEETPFDRMTIQEWRAYFHKKYNYIDLRGTKK